MSIIHCIAYITVMRRTFLTNTLDPGHGTIHVTERIGSYAFASK